MEIFRPALPPSIYYWPPYTYYLASRAWSWAYFLIARPHLVWNIGPASPLPCNLHLCTGGCKMLPFWFSSILYLFCTSVNDITRWRQWRSRPMICKLILYLPSSLNTPEESSPAAWIEETGFISSLLPTLCTCGAGFHSLDIRAMGSYKYLDGSF